eukprot:676704-Prorocentrum_lima.AAC.1
MPGIPPLQPSADRTLMHWGEIPPNWHVATVLVTAEHRREDTRHMLLPDEAPGATLLYIVAENMGLAPKS